MNFFIKISLILSLILSLPVILIIVAFFYLIRALIIILSKILRFDYDIIISGMEVVFTTDTIWNQPSYNIELTLIVQGEIDPEAFNQEFYNTFILPSNNESSSKYKRLVQFPEAFLGYYFWKWDRNLNLNNHIHYLNGTEHGIHGGNFHEFIAQHVTRKSYQRNMPLWEIYIVQGFNQEKLGKEESLVIVKFHHVVMDGKSFIKMLQQGFSRNLNLNKPRRKSLRELPSVIKRVQNKANNTSLLQSLVIKMKDLPKGGATILHDLCSLYDSKLLLEESKSNTTDLFIGSTYKFNLKEFTEIKNKLGVNIISLILSGLSSGLAKYMRKYQNANNGQVPDQIYLLSPAPIPEHPDHALVNHFTLGCMSMPLPSTKNKLNYMDLIQNLNGELSKSLQSWFPSANYYGLKILGLFPTTLVSKIIFGKSTTIFSNVAGPTEPIDLFGHQVVDFQACFPICGETRAITFILLSYLGHFHITVTGAKKCVNTQEELNDLVGLINNELKTIVSSFNNYDS